MKGTCRLFLFSAFAQCLEPRDVSLNECLLFPSGPGFDLAFVGNGSLYVLVDFRIDQCHGTALICIPRGETFIVPEKPIFQIGGVPHIKGAIRAAEDIDVVFL